MSQQAALAFFRAVRERPDLRKEIARWGCATSAGDLAALAAREGFPCAPGDLEAAFRHDWMMRWVRENPARWSDSDADEGSWAPVDRSP